ncbi:MAG: hypothetical protein EHM48_07640, partial [Planctomycetaceae bacterium]
MTGFAGLAGSFAEVFLLAVVTVVALVKILALSVLTFAVLDFATAAVLFDLPALFFTGLAVFLGLFELFDFFKLVFFATSPILIWATYG